ncbi:MAG: hypothetical protein LBR29_00185 [Methylobacteriaceae bacterium]|jgi:hypothetical protein|nr:hypothetical protein [Methylobacteriaceae bacterium]
MYPKNIVARVSLSRPEEGPAEEKAVSVPHSGMKHTVKEGLRLVTPPVVWTMARKVMKR